MSRSIQGFAFGIIVVGLTATSVRADLTVTLTDATVAPGGTGTVDINVTSTNGTDTLSAFNLELLITGVGTPAANLHFSSGIDQPVPYGNPDYVFAGESSNNDLSLPLWSDPTNPPTYNVITGGDSDDGNGSTPGYVTIPSTPGAPRTYLATVQFSLPPGAGTPGDQYNISLVNDPGQTYFDDPCNNPLQYTANEATVTIASVPEPSTLPVVILCIFGGMLYSYRNFRSPR